MNETREEKSKGLLGTAAVMAILILLAKLLGLLRDILVARTYGTTAAAIAYETASRLPVLIFDLVIGGVVSAAFIPVFSELLVREGKKAAMRYAAAYVNRILLLTGVITAAGVLFAPALVELLAPELGEEVKALAVTLSRILFPMVICTGLAYSFVGILQSMGEFRIPAVISLVSNCIMVGYLVFVGDRFGIRGLAAAMLVGWASQAVVQIPRLRALGFRPAWRTPGESGNIRRSLRLAVPILIGTWTQPLCAVVNTRFASAMEGGRAITALGYANRLYTILVGVFSFVATNLLFPYFSRASAAGETGESRRLMRVSVRTLVFLIAPIAVGLAVLAEPIAALVYERGEFTAADTALTAAALRMYAVGMLFMAVSEVLTKAFFAERRPVIPMVTSLCAMAVNFVLVVPLSRFGVGGIALASGLSTAVQCAANAAAMARLPEGGWRLGEAWDLGRSVLAAAGMGAAVRFLLPHLPGGRLLSTLAAAALGAAVYALLTLLLRSEEARFLVGLFKRKSKEDAT